MYEYRASLTRVVDGDTVHLDVDLGFQVHVQLDVRLAHINAPEMATQAGQDARAYAVAWFAAHPALLVRTEKDKQEKYGRYLANIYSADAAGPNDQSLNAAMVAAGHAVPYEGGAR